MLTHKRGVGRGRGTSREAKNVVVGPFACQRGKMSWPSVVTIRVGVPGLWGAALCLNSFVGNELLSI